MNFGQKKIALSVQLDLPMSPCIYFDAPRREKRDGVRIILPAISGQVTEL